MKRPTLLAALAAAVLATSASAQTELRYKFTDGEVAKYETTTDTEGDVPAPGMKIKTLNKQTIISERAVKSVGSDGAAEIVDKTESLKMSTDMKGGPVPMSMSWDSESGDPPGGQLAMAAGFLTALVGSETTYTMTPLGEVKDAAFADEVKEAAKTLPNGEAMLQQFSVTGMPLPEKAVAVGDTWPYEVKSGTGATVMTMKGEQTLKSVDGDIAVLEGEFTVSIEGEMMPGMKMTVKESDGTIVTRFNVAEGHIEKQSTTLDMTTDINFGGQTMTTGTKSKTEVVRK